MALSSGLCVQLSAAVVEELKKHGIYTVANFIAGSVEDLSHRTGLPTQVLGLIRRSLVSQTACPVTAAELWQEMDRTAALLPTGCPSLDNLLEGGLLTGEVVEITGPPSSGKTQLCLSITAAVAAGTPSCVVAMDTGAGFSATRLQHLLPGRAEEAMSKVKVYRVFSVFELLSVIEALSQNITHQVDHFHSNLHLVVIDSITILLSQMLGSHTQGHAVLSHVASSLHHLAHEHAVAIVYTNNMVSDVRSGGLRPALGQTWSHHPTSQITLACLQPGIRRTATLTASTRQPAGIATEFHISRGGLQHCIEDC